MRPEQPLQKLLKDQFDSLPNFREKIQQLIDLNKLWRAQLDPLLAEHCRVANLREKCLIIEVDSAAWVMRLRYLIPELLDRLRAAGVTGIQAIEWYIQPPDFYDSIETTSKSLVLSEENKELLREAAQNVSSAALQQALNKIGGK
jgi:hypothetical protein